MLLRGANDSVLGDGGRRGGEGETGMEKPMTDEAGSNGWEAEAAPGPRGSNDLFRTSSVDSGTGAGVGVGAGVDAVDKISQTAHGATISCCVVPSRG